MIKTTYTCDVCGEESEDKNFLKSLNLEVQINGNVVIGIQKDVCPDCSGGVTEGNTKVIKKDLTTYLNNAYSLKGEPEAEEVPEIEEAEESQPAESTEEQAEEVGEVQVLEVDGFVMEAQNSIPAQFGETEPADSINAETGEVTLAGKPLPEIGNTFASSGDVISEMVANGIKKSKGKN